MSRPYMGGWPREEWEPILTEWNYDDTRNFVSVLVDDVAVQYPDATVEFRHVTFAVSGIHGALKRLLPPKRKEEVLQTEIGELQRKWQRETGKKSSDLWRTLCETEVVLAKFN